MLKWISLMALATGIAGCMHVEKNDSSSIMPRASAVEPNVYVDDQGQLMYSLKRAGTPVVMPSKMGITLEGVELGAGVVLSAQPAKRIEGSFEWLGNSAVVENNYTAQNYAVTHSASGRKWMLETRLYDTGFAFRYVVPGAGSQRVDGEDTTWNLPTDAELWHRQNGDSFQYYWSKSKAADIEAGFNAQLNVTVELSDGSYASLNEGGSFSFSGASLEFNGSNEANTIFADDKEGWTIEGEVATPWRIVMTGPDLNTLVNCTLVAAVCPAPDQALYPEGCHTDWIVPGRSLWQWWGYWDPGTQWEKQRWFVDNAAALGCLYYMVDEGWEHPRQGWATETRTAWEAMKELADYAETKGVRLLVWRGYPTNEEKYWSGMETVEKRTAFYVNSKKAGIYGVKIDFMDSESVVHSTFMETCLKEAAGYELMVNYHGAPKPTGAERTYPNQITREGVVGMEHNKWETIPRSHYATSPFTRFLAGSADFTPTTFQPGFVKGTTFALQLAQPIVYTSPVLHWADKPQYYLNSPAVDLIRSMPTTWDETIVLPSSKIGIQAAYVRRKGQDWYVGIINGSDDAVEQPLDLSFLGEGRFAATLFKDVPGQPVVLKKELLIAERGDSLAVRMSPGGGFVAVFRKLEARPYGGGIYGQQVVALRFVEGAEVRYTLDGSEPTVTSTKYTEPFTVRESCRLRAKVVSGDGKGTEISARFTSVPKLHFARSGAPCIAQPFPFHRSCSGRLL